MRVLVERLWPRGIKKEALVLDGWIKDVAPSTELRRWFDHDPERWDEFRKRYQDELVQNQNAWTELLQAARRGTVTLLYSARDEEHNGALVLREFLQHRLRKAHASSMTKPQLEKQHGTKRHSAQSKPGGKRA